MLAIAGFVIADALSGPFASYYYHKKLLTSKVESAITTKNTYHIEI